MKIPDSIVELNEKSGNYFSNDTLHNIMQLVKEKGTELTLNDLSDYGIKKDKFIECDDEGNTLLHKLVSSKALEFDKDSYRLLAVKILLAIFNGEKLSISENNTTISAINIKNHQGRTALHELVLSPQVKKWNINKDPSAIEYKLSAILCNSGAEINTKDNDGWTPLEHAAKLALNSFDRRSKSYNDAVFAILLELGANPYLKDFNKKVQRTMFWKR